MTTNPPVRLAAVCLAAPLTLTACSFSEDFDFTETSMGPTESIEFVIPDELLEQEEEYAENRVFSSITLTAIEPDDPTGCAVEYEYNYTEDGYKRLVEYLNSTSSTNSGEERISSVLTSRGPDSVEYDENYDSAEVPVDCAVSPDDDDNTARVSFIWVDGEEESVPSLAEAHVSVMQGGELYVQETEVSGDWQVDSNGNWIQ